jgi:hypothetical protein
MVGSQIRTGGVMSNTRAASGRGLPWTQLFLEKLPVEPIWGGLVLVVTQLALGSAYRYSLGFQQKFVPDIVFALLIGVAPVAAIYSRRATLARLDDLRPALDVSESRFAALAEEITGWDWTWSRLSGVVALVVATVVVWNEPGVVRDSPPGHAMFPWVLYVNLAAIWLSTRTITQEVVVSWRISRLGRDHAVVDVLDQGPLRPFARHGAQGALIPILTVTIFSMLYISGDAGDAVPFTVMLVVSISAASALIPVHGVHLRLAEQKRQRLARVAEAIREAQEPVLAARPGEAGDGAAHLHALLALRAQLEASREWPWDVPTVVRLALYVAIGLGSWLGGALVERIVDLVLS